MIIIVIIGSLPGHVWYTRKEFDVVADEFLEDFPALFHNVFSRYR